MTRLEEVAGDVKDAALALRLRPGQQRFVSTVAQSLADAAQFPDTAWPRAIVDRDEVVGFVMGGFSDDELRVFFHPGPDGPQGFWEHLGFVISDPNARPEVPARRPL